MRRVLISKGRIFGMAGMDQICPVSFLEKEAVALGIKDFIILPDYDAVSYLYNWVQDEISEGKLEKLR